MRIKLEKTHKQWGLTAFLVIIASVAVISAVYKFSIISGAFKVVAGVAAPFIYGLVMAYLLCPIYNGTVRQTYRLLNKADRKFKHEMALAKTVGTVVSLLILLCIITGFVWMVVPGLMDSIVNIVEVVPDAMKSFEVWIETRMARLPVSQETVALWVDTLSVNMTDFVTNTLLPTSTSIAASVSLGVINVLSSLIDFVIGIIVCAYFLNIKDKLAAQLKKLILAGFNEKVSTEILDCATITNKTFGGFISGKIIDSIIIGIICYIVMIIFGWEYALLISCIILVTNIIPFFGPFIGAVPSVLLLLTVEPRQALFFAIFVMLLQQFDGNILGPKILGDSTGLESFWVLFAVIVGGGLFGFIGMVIGIPVFAVIYYYVARIFNARLERKGYSSNTSDYIVDKYRVPKKKKKKNKTDGEQK